MTVFRLGRRASSAVSHIVGAAASAVRTARSLAGLKRSGRKVLLIGLVQHIGDIVAAEPVVRQLRELHPDALFVWCARAPYLELAGNFPEIDAALPVHCLTEWIILRKFLRAEHIIDLHVNGCACAICTIRLHKGEDRSGVRLENYFNFGSLSDIYARIAGVATTGMPRIGIPGPACVAVNQLMLPERFITIHALSEQPIKNWPTGNWNELVRLLRGLRLAVAEVGLQAAIGTEDAQNPVIDLCGRLSILETAEVIRRSILFVGIDSGPAHIANGVGTPAIILLGRYYRYASYNPFRLGESCTILQSPGQISELSLERVFETIKDKLRLRTIPDRP
jgi:heptosyltransferase-3